MHKCQNTNTVRKIILSKDPKFFKIFQSLSDPSMIFTFQCTVGTIYSSVLTVLTFVKILSYLCSSFQQLHFMSHFINSNRSNNLLCPTLIPTSVAHDCQRKLLYIYSIYVPLQQSKNAYLITVLFIPYYHPFCW